jgi:hypothetical protein
MRLEPFINSNNKIKSLSLFVGQATLIIMMLELSTIQLEARYEWLLLGTAQTAAVGPWVSLF